MEIERLPSGCAFGVVTSLNQGENRDKWFMVMSRVISQNYRAWGKATTEVGSRLFDTFLASSPDTEEWAEINSWLREFGFVEVTRTPTRTLGEDYEVILWMYKRTGEEL